ncbi:hypothetical protein HMPREF1987_00775 [Peptostreptococcaceae bacterium oral taxon 113 str. W5053]|nr:hypothetical protein HMPREF1987_00775 [Peptostreptococcaceae bacterium oral taxon 113 str. W5053]
MDEVFEKMGGVGFSYLYALLFLMLSPIYLSWDIMTAYKNGLTFKRRGKTLECSIF